MSTRFLAALASGVAAAGFTNPPSTDWAFALSRKSRGWAESTGFSPEVAGIVSNRKTALSNADALMVGRPRILPWRQGAIAPKIDS